MEINVDKILTTAVRTGKVVIGSNQTIDAISKGSAKLVVLSSNCPSSIRDRIKGVPVIGYHGTSVDLGINCGKPFPIATLAILEATESDLAALRSV